MRLSLGVALVAMTVSGCGGGSRSAVQPMEIAADAGTQAVAQLDANKDGVLDYNELAKAPGLRAGVAKIKKLAAFRGPAPSESQLKSAKITAEEIDARIQEWKNSKAGRVNVSCRVVHMGKKGNRMVLLPVVDAEVRLVPEAFLGPGLASGTGKTDRAGMAVVSQAKGPGDAPGVSPGFYRVEITKGNEIPAKYNTDTALGIEVAADSVQILSGTMTFELAY